MCAVWVYQVQQEHVGYALARKDEYLFTFIYLFLVIFETKKTHLYLTQPGIW